jgi:site-specific DNA-methyltransferase (adenine-specific)
VIKLFSEADDIVLDCFIGSGTTAIAAISEGRRFIGIDKEKKSIEIALNSISSFEHYRKEPEQIDFFIREVEEEYHKKT